MWDSRAEILLRHLVHDGLSCGRISLAMKDEGYSFSRNAIIGKCNRLNLELPRKPTKVIAPPEASSYRKSTMTKLRPSNSNKEAEKNRKLRVGAVAKAMKEIEAKHFLRDPKLCVSLESLGSDACHWPAGLDEEGRIAFCGCAKSGKSPYCTDHEKVAFRTGTKWQGPQVPQHHQPIVLAG